MSPSNNTTSKQSTPPTATTTTTTTTTPPTVLPPPMDPCGPDDIKSFAALDHALRATPELQREGSHVLSAKALSLITAGIRRFQDVHLGKDAKGNRWPMVRLPDSIFRDRSRNGPLYAALLAAYRHKATQSWRTFDFDNPKRFDDNLALLKKMETDLEARGYVSRPKIYFDTTISPRRLPSLRQTALRFGATLVPSPTLSTHILAHDIEIDNSSDVQAETAKDLANEPPDRTYLRTLCVKGGKKNPKALVHWWFWPGSADEWIPAGDVDGVGEEEATRAEGGSWVVCERFVRDVGRFNEWGVEEDYAILDYKDKVDCFKKPHLMNETLNNLHTNKPSLTITNPTPNDNLTPSNDTTATTKRPRNDEEDILGMDPRIIGWSNDENTASSSNKTMTAGGSSRKRQRLVFDGALRLPKTVRSMIDALVSPNEKEKEMMNDNDAIKDDTKKPLPTPVTVLPYSKDGSVGTMIITELSFQKQKLQPDDNDGICQTSSTVRLIATNRRIDRPKQSLHNMESLAPISRLRGGGDDDDNNGDNTGTEQKNDEQNVPQASLPPPTPLAAPSKAPPPRLLCTSVANPLAPNSEQQLMKPPVAAPLSRPPPQDKPSAPSPAPQPSMPPPLRQPLSLPLSVPNPIPGSSQRTMTSTTTTASSSLTMRSHLNHPVASPLTHLRPPPTAAAPSSLVKSSSLPRSSTVASSSLPRSLSAVPSPLPSSSVPSPLPATRTKTTLPPVPLPMSTLPTGGLKLPTGGLKLSKVVMSKAAADQKQPNKRMGPSPTPPAATKMMRVSSSENTTPQPPSVGRTPASSRPVPTPLAVAPSISRPVPTPLGGGRGAVKPMIITSQQPSSTTGLSYKPPLQNPLASLLSAAHSVASPMDQQQPVVVKKEAATVVKAPVVATKGPPIIPVPAPVPVAAKGPSIPVPAPVGQQVRVTASTTTAKPTVAPPAPLPQPPAALSLKPPSTKPPPKLNTYTSTTTGRTLIIPSTSPPPNAPPIKSFKPTIIRPTTTTTTASPKPPPTTPTPPTPSTSSSTTPTPSKLPPTPPPPSEPLPPPHTYPPWYSPSTPSPIERLHLPEWFNSSAPHRTPQTYIKTRNAVLSLGQKYHASKKYLTGTQIRHLIGGDCGSLMRLYRFLGGNGMVNAENGGWSGETMPRVVRPMEEEEEEGGSGGGVSVEEVLRNNHQGGGEGMVKDLISSVDPQLLSTAFNAALSSTSPPNEKPPSSAATAGLLASLATQSLRHAQENESQIETLLVDIVAARMEKVENRLGLIEDVEKMLECERVCLELERRDLFARRCRYWMGS